ncbi:MAG TPA: aldo/keto reductase [Methylomirabilota bacterium]|nr:aldo/keto reductase [Methylomirabilota bacterium]
MTTRATPEDTKSYAQRFATAEEAGHFRKATLPGEALTVSSIGIGTYLGQPDAGTDEAYAAAVAAAVENGINFIDSAINYRLQRSERSIGAALEQLRKKGYPREQVVLCTKGGYLTPDGAVPSDANEYFFREYIQKGVFRAKDIVAGCHCMAPAYLEDQIERSRRNLGVEAIDVYYLHNPETQLGEVSPGEFLARVRAAFSTLESAASSGRIGWYGMATWNGFRQEAGSPGALQLEEITQLARELAGDQHRFRFVQLPCNLAMTEALTLGNQTVAGRTATMAEAAEALGITLVASASLLQGQVARNLPGFVREAFELETDAECALQFTRSSPGITTALVGMSRVEHVRANARLTQIPPASLEQFQKLFERGESA